MARKFKTMDGNTAAATVSYAFTEVAAIYPITPSSVMAELTDEWAAHGLKNIFGQTVKIAEMQSEGGAAGAVHGSITAGALTTTYTASQGLLLMIPNMYKIAGELLPAVFHVSARTVAAQSLNIFGDHSDVMACRQTGFAMLAEGNVQEVMDLAPVAHLSAIKGRVPFINFFDGFRTSHEIQKVAIWDYKDLAEMVDMDAVEAFRKRALNPERPTMRGSHENGDIFFQHREACNPYYDALPEIVEEYMGKVNEKLGTNYQLFNYYGAEDADRVIIAMGSICDVAEEVIDYLNANGQKVGLIKVRLYRPFRADKLIAAIPATAKKIAVLDRTKEPGALGDPLYLDVITALSTAGITDKTVVAGRYGLGSKDTPPKSVFAVYENLAQDAPKNHFTIGIVDDVTNSSLEEHDAPNTAAEGTIECKFWGLGGDGTVGANKNSIKIIGDHTDLKVQAYFQYDSKKSGGITISHLRFGPQEIKSTYYVKQADFVACHNPAYLAKYQVVQDVKKGGTLLINSGMTVEELGQVLPADAKRHIAQYGVNVYTCDATKIAREIGLGNRTNMVLQAAFFKLANIIPIDDAVKYMKAAIETSYGAKGQNVVDMNKAAVDAGLTALVKLDIPADWADAVDTVAAEKPHSDRSDVQSYLDTVMFPAAAMEGDVLTTSQLLPGADGTLPAGTAAFEKRGTAVTVPEWIPENCIQCNQCSMVCPHAVIRPLALDADEVAAAPAGMKMVDFKNKKYADYKFAIVVSPMDCTGCGSCANVCPAPNKALVMKPLLEQEAQQEIFNETAYTVTEKDMGPLTVVSAQFRQPLLEFSGACGGCGETPYAKLVTQLFGDRMYVANATGCSSIWGGSAPSTPYTVNKKGQGPAWENSLFEDAAEFGYGMNLAVTQRRAKLIETVETLAGLDYADEEIVAACNAWLAARDNAEESRKTGDALVAVIEDYFAHQDQMGTPFEEQWLANGKKCLCPACTAAREILEKKDLLTKKSMWIFGGDGFAYDIGYGGLDHVLASRENVNVFIFDTEVYSNTGGQSSKSTPTGAVAQFAAAGKAVKKKDMASIFMQYGYVYVAQIAMGANMNQTLQAIREAEAYDGPSIIIAYAPCINHGLKKKGGMANAMSEMKAAVAAGYWHLFRFNPALAEQGKNPFTMDSKAPTEDYQSFLMGETRYASLKLAFPERAEKLYAQAEQEAHKKYEHFEKMAKQ